MKKAVPAKVEKCRVTTGPMASDSTFGFNGGFLLPHNGVLLSCIVSDGLGWEHVSVVPRKPNTRKLLGRTPTWEEMDWIKGQFWDDDEAVMQLHPPRADWVNNHEYCLHLWKPTSATIPLPPSMMVGFKDLPKGLVPLR
jgi:hypothetical protein